MKKKKEGLFSFHDIIKVDRSIKNQSINQIIKLKLFFYLQVPSVWHLFLEKSPPRPHLEPTGLAVPGLQTNCRLVRTRPHFGLLVQRLVALPQTARTGRLVQN